MRIKKITSLALALMLVLTGCGAKRQDIAPNHTVRQKRHFKDEKGDHWILDCKIGVLLDANGKTFDDIDKQEVTKDKYDKTKAYDHERGIAGDPC